MYPQQYSTEMFLLLLFKVYLLASQRGGEWYLYMVIRDFARQLDYCVLFKPLTFVALQKKRV